MSDVVSQEDLDEALRRVMQEEWCIDMNDVPVDWSPELLADILNEVSDE